MSRFWIGGQCRGAPGELDQPGISADVNSTVLFKIINADMTMSLTIILIGFNHQEKGLDI